MSSAPKRKTKIIVTVGPASRSPEMIKNLILAGVNVFRLNFSHGTYEEHLQSLTTIRDVAKSVKRTVAVLQDLSGPKIRISVVQGDSLMLQDHQSIELRPALPDSKSTTKCIFVEGLDPIKILKPGQQVLLADGIISLRCEEVKSDLVRCSVTTGAALRSRVGISFPDSVVDLPATTEKDLKDFDWALKNQLDFVAISFVQDAQDILRLRGLCKKVQHQPLFISKIERKAALENIHEILEVSDGIMVARGDLGLELPLEQVPLVQKRLIEQANYRGIPAIVATQMLHSMVTSVRPTRAEVSDIATAVMNGADALMLSEETAIGQHPIECVIYLEKIAREAEQSFAFSEFKLRLRDSDSATVPDAVAYAAAAAAIKVNAAAIIACTETGTSARLIAKYRPQQPLYGVSSNAQALARMCMFWGVLPIVLTSSTSTHEDEIKDALRSVQLSEGLPNGSRAIVTGGLSVHKAGSTSILEICEMVYR